MSEAQPLFNRRADPHPVRGEPAWSVHENERGIIVCRPRYFALGDRDDPEWEARERRKLGDDAFSIAQGESWDVPAGNPYLPLFADRVKETEPWKFEGWYVRDAPAIFPRLLIRRGFDGGLHRPALILCQYDPQLGVFWAMREFRPVTSTGTPVSMLAHEFASVCRYLCGQATLQQLEREEKENRWTTAAALAWIAEERRRPFYGWEMPWIQPGTDGVRFIDVMAKHEARSNSQFGQTLELNSLKKVYRQQGLALRSATEGWDHRELALQFLLREGPIPGLPRLLVDSSCKTLLKGLAGGLTVARPGAAKPYTEPTPWLEDAFDAFMNAVCSAFPLSHAHRMDALDRQHEQQRLAALAKDETPRGNRWVPPQATRAEGSSWGRLRRSFEETPNGW